eukprot:15415498-Alexandrium_andersonii.AAC.1
MRWSGRSPWVGASAAPSGSARCSRWPEFCESSVSVVGPLFIWEAPCRASVLSRAWRQARCWLFAAA